MMESPTTTMTYLCVLNLLAFIANIAFVNGVPSWFDLPDNAELSRKYQTIVTPAGWAFAIWGLIFLMQAIWSTIQILVPKFRRNPLVIQGVGYNYVWVCLFQVSWTFAFSTEKIGLSMTCMLGILFFLMRIYIAQDRVFEQDDTLRQNSYYWLLRFPFGLHFGWILAATLVNANVVLVAMGMSATVQFSAGLISLFVILFVTAFTLYAQFKETRQHPDFVIPFVLSWALFAISVELGHPKELIETTFTVQQIDNVKNGAITAAVLVVISTFATVVALSYRRQANSNRPEGEHLLS